MDSDQLSRALEILEQSGVVGMPTETVYGLAARIDRPAGIDLIFTTKARPDFDPLIVHVASIEQAKTCASYWSQNCQYVAEAFWPGPLTMVVPKAKAISSKITSGLESVGLRCPNHPVSLELIARAGALAAPSANRFGKTSPTTREHVLSEFNQQVFTLEGGRCQVGIESTVVGIFDDRLEIYRPGMVTASMLAAVVDVPVLVKESPVSPGSLKHHYMPDVPMYVIDHGVALPSQLQAKNLSQFALADAAPVAARELYQKMREACAPGIEALLLVRKPNQTGEDWDAIWNRVAKASTQI